MTNGKLTLYDKLKLYPEIILEETINNKRSQLQSLLEKIKNPSINDNLGLILEDFAKMFLESHYLKFNHARRRCEAGEIDLDFTVKRFEATLFYEFSYLLIVECKNWKKKVGAPEIRVFCSKVREVNGNIGIVFATKGITKDGTRIIRDSYKRDKIVVLVFELQDLEKVINKQYNLYEILHQKYIAVITASKE